MSWFRFAGASRKGTGGDKFLTRIFSRLRAASKKRGGPKRRSSNGRGGDMRRGRVLAIDPLESRCLLSVAPATLSAVIVNQTYGAAQSSNTAHSVAVDNAGDFVVTWTSTGSFTDAAGTAFPVTNVEARYFTNTVQQVNLPTSLVTTTGTKQTYFSLKYDDQTVEQISVTGEAQAPSGDPTAPFSTDIQGTFNLFYNATGKDTQGQMDPTVTGGTQSDTLTVDYDETATYANGVEVTGPQVASQEIQQWLNAFTPQPANAAAGFAGSDATHATVNAIDPHTFVVDYGQATEGLDQSALLQYVSTEPFSGSQDLTFTSTAGSTTTFPLPAPGQVEVPLTTPNVVFPDNIALQVGNVQTAEFTFDGGNPANTAMDMQTALTNAGFTGATVTYSPFSTVVNGVNTNFIFNVTFPTAEPPIQYVIPTDDFNAPQVSFSNDADVSSFTSGFLPAVAISTLDKPFTINNIPFSQTNPALTAESMAGAFQAQVDSFSTGVAPYNFVSNSPQTAFSVTGVTVIQQPYTTPVSNNVGSSTTSQTPATGWNPTISVTPVVQVNSGGTDTTSFNEFQVTFTSATGTIVDAPLVVTSMITANGGTTTGSTTNLDGTVAVPTNVSGATVTVLKQSGNEFQVNPPQAASVYTANQAPLNATQPAVAMDGTGEFVVTWAGDVSQELAPKGFTDIYARVFAPVGATAAGTAVPDVVNSDLYQQQELTLSFTGAIPTSNTDQFELAIGPFTTAPIVFNTDPSTTAANIENALIGQFPGITVAANSSGNPFNFEVTFDEGGVSEPPIQYVADPDIPLPAAMTFAAAPEQSFTGVRLVTNPTQSLTFDFTAGAPTATGNLGTFILQVGSFTTAAINFNSSPSTTALNMQNALRNAGFAGVAVSAQSVNSISPTFFTFNITFSGYDIPAAQYVPIAAASGGLPASVTMTNGGSGLPAGVGQTMGAGDPYTIQVNANYTNPQFQPAVAMDPYGNFVVVWANQGPDESFFNDITMQCFDNTGNPLGNALVVDQDPSNPTINYNTDTNFDPGVAIGLVNLNSTAPATDDIAVTYTTAVSLPSQIANQPDGSVYVRGYTFNPEQKQGPSPMPWNQLQVAGDGGLSSVSLDGQNNFYVAWQQTTDQDVNGETSTGVYGVEYQMENYTTGAALAAPANLRPTFRFNSSSDDTTTQSFWPFTQEAVQVQATISGDIVSSFSGYGPQVSDDISIPSSFFTSQFALEQQKLSFSFTGSPSTFTFNLLAGSAVAGPITFSTNVGTTASNIQAALQTALGSLGFTAPAATVTGTASGTTYTFTVTFGIGPDEPALALAGALPATVTFSNSVAVPAAAPQQLTFTAGSVPVSGVFELQIGAQNTSSIYFDSTDPANTAAGIQTALVNLGLAGTTVTVDPTSTATSFIFDVTFAAAESPVQFVAVPAPPATLAFSAAITTAWNNADLLAYFDPFTNGAGNSLVGTGSTADFGTAAFNFETLYQEMLGSTRGGITADSNLTVTTAIDQVLFGAEYEPPQGVPAATQTQLSRLDAILEDVAGLLRGEAAGVMTSQWDANSLDSTNSTYSDNLVSTQRQGEEQRYYLVIPYDVQQGAFSLALGFAPPTESPNDVAGFTGVTTVNTPLIQMPSTVGAEPGGKIKAQSPANNITE